MVGPAVELDDQAGGRPRGVDLVALDDRDYLRGGKVVSGAVVDEVALEAGTGSFIGRIVVPGLGQSRKPVVAVGSGAGGVDGMQVEQVQLLGAFEGAG